MNNKLNQNSKLIILILTIISKMRAIFSQSSIPPLYITSKVRRVYRGKSKTLKNRERTQ